jgi:transcriptional regulator with PAS, ATPase and Fis domain
MKVSTLEDIDDLIGQSEAILKVLKQVESVAQSNSSVIITGESGTGKELVARAIHSNSPRKYFPLVSVHCGALTESLLESELFGHEKGAFTGAMFNRKGRFEMADGGTIFLDEIATISSKMQVELLRVLETKSFVRVGGNKEIASDFRVICATNRDLKSMVKSGNFREDLYYRLKVITIDLPPLRERKEDMPELVSFFIKKYNQEFGKRVKDIEENALKALRDYHWPGNIRQLESVIERAVLMCGTPHIGLKDIKSELRFFQGKGILDFDLPDEGINVDELEKDLLKKAMQKANGVAAKAAKLLGMSYKTFWYRWEKLNLQSPKKDAHP